MARDLHEGPAEQLENDTQAASGGPKPVGHPRFADVALTLLENGYEPLPLKPKEKRPAVDAWTTLTIDEAQVVKWIDEFPNAGVGLRAGHLVGIDIDVLDPDIAHQMGQIVEARTGATLMRVGLWPKRLYLARTATPFSKKSIRKLEILGKGSSSLGLASIQKHKSPTIGCQKRPRSTYHCRTYRWWTRGCAPRFSMNSPHSCRRSAPTSVGPEQAGAPALTAG